MTRFHATSEGDVPFTAEEEAAWDAMMAITPEKLQVFKDKCILQIDADADYIYRAALGNRATEYAQAETDAQAYKTAGYSGTVPAYVQAWATATGKSAQWAADDILTTAGNWRAAQTAIRQNRLLRKEGVRAAGTVADVNTVMTQWNTFLPYIRGQLGI